MSLLFASADSTRGFTHLLGAAALMVLMAYAWVSSSRADQKDPRSPKLLKTLKAASDPAEGARVGRRIAEIWNQHDNQGVEEIMRQGQSFLALDQLGPAQGNFTTVTRMEPGFAEA